MKSQRHFLGLKPSLSAYLASSRMIIEDNSGQHPARPEHCVVSWPFQHTKDLYFSTFTGHSCSGLKLKGHFRFDEQNAFWVFNVKFSLCLVILLRSFTLLFKTNVMQDFEHAWDGWQLCGWSWRLSLHEQKRVKRHWTVVLKVEPSHNTSSAPSVSGEKSFICPTLRSLSLLNE